MQGAVLAELPTNGLAILFWRHGESTLQDQLEPKMARYPDFCLGSNSIVGWCVGLRQGDEDGLREGDGYMIWMGCRVGQ